MNEEVVLCDAFKRFEKSIGVVSNITVNVNGSMPHLLLNSYLQRGAAIRSNIRHHIVKNYCVFENAEKFSTLLITIRGERTTATIEASEYKSRDFLKIKQSNTRSFINSITKKLGFPRLLFLGNNMRIEDFVALFQRSVNESGEEDASKKLFMENIRVSLKDTPSSDSGIIFSVYESANFTLFDCLVRANPPSSLTLGCGPSPNPQLIS
jgi:hypothetical protein